MTRCLLLVVMLCGSACIDWDSLGGTNGGGDGGTGNAKRLFASGFEGDSRIDPLTGPAVDTKTRLRGTDPNTGYSWETSPYNNNGHGFELVYWFAPQAPGNAVDHLQNTIDTVTGFNGSSTHALKMQTGTMYPGFDVSSELAIDGLAQAVTDYYVRMRVKLDPMVLSTLNGGYERSVWDTGTGSDFLIDAWLDYTGVHNWNLWIGNPADQQSGSQITIPESSVPLPVDRWFVMEVFLHRATDQTGHVVWAADGKLLVDMPGPTFGAQRAALDELSLIQIGGHVVMSSYQWVDDLEIWSAPPCQQMPCGMP